MAHGHGHSHGGDPVHEHRQAGTRAARCLVVTVSDTRTPENDKSGDTAGQCLSSAGHEVARREIIPDDRARITELVQSGIADGGIDAVVLTGGTGVAPRDVTYEAVRDVLEKPLDGFGELFRSLSYEEIGAAAMLSRAIGGVSGSTAVFALPGSTKAVRLGIDKLVGPELGHILGLIRP